jgi:hypothetical protein
MHATGSPFSHPAFREGVVVKVMPTSAEIGLGQRMCSFEFGADDRTAVLRLLEDLEAGGFTFADLQTRSPVIADGLTELIVDLDQQGLLFDSAPGTASS